MTKTATSVEEQISLLKSRGMIFNCENKAKELLLDIGYYRLGFYWYFFENKKHTFKENINFKEVVKLYYLNADLRHLLIKYLNRIEINFRTKVVYYTSNRYKQHATWFVHPSAMNRNYIKKFDKIYTDNFKEKNLTIAKHHKRYINDKYAPAWKTLEYMTFGAIFKTYKNLLDKELKTLIAKEYGLINIKVFQNLMNTLVFLRNTCAHGGILYDLQTPLGIINIKNELVFNNNDRHSLDACIKVMIYILNGISQNRATELKNEVNNLFIKYKNNNLLRDIIESKIGFKFT